MGGGAAWLAYQLLGRAHPGSAALLLRWSTLGALPIAAGLPVLVTVTGAGYGLVAVAIGQMAFQMAATTLV